MGRSCWRYWHHHRLNTYIIMTPKQYEQALRSFISNQDMSARVLSMGFNLVAAVRQRVENTGIDRQGKAFAPYTPSYAKQKLKAGYQIRQVNYRAKGALWNSITPQIVSDTPELIAVEIAPRGRENEVKLLGAGTTRPRKDGVERGLPTLPSKEELEEAFNELIEELFIDFENSFP